MNFPCMRNRQTALTTEAGHEHVSALSAAMESQMPKDTQDLLRPLFTAVAFKRGTGAQRWAETDLSWIYLAIITNLGVGGLFWKGKPSLAPPPPTLGIGDLQAHGPGSFSVGL